MWRGKVGGGSLARHKVGLGHLPRRQEPSALSINHDSIIHSPFTAIVKFQPLSHIAYSAHNAVVHVAIGSALAAARPSSSPALYVSCPAPAPAQACCFLLSAAPPSCCLVQRSLNTVRPGITLRQGGRTRYALHRRASFALASDPCSTLHFNFWRDVLNRCLPVQIHPRHGSVRGLRTFLSLSATSYQCSTVTLSDPSIAYGLGDFGDMLHRP